MNTLRRWTLPDWLTAAVAAYVIAHVLVAFGTGAWPIYG